MGTKNNNLAECCKELKNLANIYLARTKSSNSFTAYFFSVNSFSSLLNTLLDSMEREEDQMNSMQLSFNRQIKFTLNLSAHYKKIQQAVINSPVDVAINEFFRKFSALCKATVKTLWGENILSQQNINLNYLEDYVDFIQVGLDEITNYEITLQNIIDTMNDYLENHQNSIHYILIKTVLNTLIHHEQSINLYAVTPNEKLLNILRFVNPLRHTLIDQNDNYFLSVLVQEMDAALEITRANTARSAKAQSLLRKAGDIIDKKISELAKDLPLISKTIIPLVTALDDEVSQIQVKTVA